MILERLLTEKEVEITQNSIFWSGTTAVLSALLVSLFAVLIAVIKQEL